MSAIRTIYSSLVVATVVFTFALNAAPAQGQPQGQPSIASGSVTCTSDFANTDQNSTCTVTHPSPHPSVPAGETPTVTLECVGVGLGADGTSWIVKEGSGSCINGVPLLPTLVPGHVTIDEDRSCPPPGRDKGLCVVESTGSGDIITNTGDDMFAAQINAVAYLDYADKLGYNDPDALQHFQRVGGDSNRALMLPSGPPGDYSDYKNFFANIDSDIVQSTNGCYPVNVELCANVELQPVCGRADSNHPHYDGPYANATHFNTRVNNAASPQDFLCDSGFPDLSLPVDFAGSGSWSYDCRTAAAPIQTVTCTATEDGDDDAVCSAVVASVNGFATPADLYNAAGGTQNDLCTEGTVANFTETASAFTWDCYGTHSGTSLDDATCSAPLDTGSSGDPVCGADTGGTFRWTEDIVNRCDDGSSPQVSFNRATDHFEWACGDNICTANWDDEEGEITPGTNACFFWVSGMPASDETYDGGISNRAVGIGLTEPAPGSGTVLSSRVGPGNYPDAYEVFKAAADKTFDSIAIGSQTRLTIHQGENYSGPVLFDQQGPMVVTNLNNEGVGPVPDAATFKTADWSGGRPLLEQFTPDTRHTSNEAPVSLPMQGGLWTLSGLTTDRAIDTFGAGSFPGSSFPYPLPFKVDYGKTSVQVSCEAACGDAVGSGPFSSPAAVENAGLCHTGTVSPAGITDSGTAFEWTCTGINGGNDTACTASQ